MLSINRTYNHTIIPMSTTTKRKKVAHMTDPNMLITTYYCRNLKHCTVKPGTIMMLDMNITDKTWSFKGVYHRTGGPAVITYFYNDDGDIRIQADWFIFIKTML
jgi:hypothetical protein